MNSNTLYDNPFAVNPFRRAPWLAPSNTVSTLPTPTPRVDSDAFAASSELKEPESGGSADMPALVGGLAENYSDGASKAKKANNVVRQVSDKNRTHRLIRRLGATADAAERASNGIDKGAIRLSAGSDLASLAASPINIASSSKQLFDRDSSPEERAVAATSLASEGASTSRVLGAATADDASSTLSKSSKVASVQRRLATKAPKLTSTLAKVGKRVPVVGGAASIADGGSSIKDAVTGKDRDAGRAASGALTVASGVALMVPGGAPVAAGLAGASLAVEHRDKIGKGAKAVAGGLADGSKFVAKNVGQGATTAFKAGRTIASAPVKAGSKVASTGSRVVGDAAKTGGSVAKGVVSAGKSGLKKLGGLI